MDRQQPVPIVGQFQASDTP
ncbi:hypothetical protein YPPY47_4656, partial [Yersinia pestis PY-47]